MAGYMTKLQGYVYDGAHIAAEAMPNGVFAEITSTGVKKIAAAGDATLRVDAIETLFGMPAVRASVIHAGTKDHFFVENEWDINDCCNYNTAEYECKVGDFVRMHRLVTGDQLIMTVADSLATTLAVGDIMKPAIAGTIAKA